jgi:hypothetical protein
VGTGESTTLWNLAEGTHEITLRATGSDGQTGSGTISIFVGQLQMIYLPIIVKGQ